MGRALRDMDLVEGAWLAGRIGRAQVGALARVRTPATEKAFERDEQVLVDGAATLRFSHLCRRLSYWSMTEDPDGAEDRAERQREGRRLHISQSFEDVFFVDGVLDPLNGHDHLRRAEANRAGAVRGRLGRGPGPPRRRGERQRPASHPGPAPGRRLGGDGRPLTHRPGRRPPSRAAVQRVGGLRDLRRAHLRAGLGTVVTPGTLVPWLDQAWIERIVFDGPSRVIDVGVHRRIFTGATRRTVEVTHRECYHGYCEISAEDCQADHIQPYSEGGLTIQDNGQMACPQHNRDRYRRT